jgi:hypothetical protein
MNRNHEIPPVIFLTGLVVLLFAAPAALSAEVAVGASISTLGVGVEAAFPLGDRFALRLGAHKGSVGRDFTEDGVDYVGDLELENASLLVDWHPAGGAFRISAGGLVNRNEVVARASADDLLLEIGNVAIPSEAVESFRGTVSFDNLSPYLGIGASTSFGRDGSWGFLFDLGVAFQGSPEVDLRGSLVPELAALEPLFQTQILVEEQNLEREIDDYDLYPVISIGVSYSF